MNKIMTLPDTEEMRRRIALVFPDDDYTTSGLWQCVRRHAGETKYGEGVVMMFTFAIHDFTDGMPAIGRTLLNLRLRDLVEAMIDDSEVLQEALALMDGAGVPNLDNPKS